MAIVRNKKPTPAQAAAIDAFTAAADARPDETPAPAPAPAPTSRKPAPDGPASSLIRWAGNEDLRDRITDYATRERYSVHHILIEALRLGIDKIDTKS